SGGDGGFEVAPAHVVGAGAGDQQAPGAQHLQGAQVEFLVTAESAFHGALGFGEGRWVEHDGVEGLAGVGPVAQEGEGVGVDPIDFSGEVRAVGGQVLLGNFEGGAGGVNAGDLAADAGEVESESALVGADVESATVGGEALGP